MSDYAPDSRPANLRGALLAVLFLSVIALGLAGTGLVLGTEPRLTLERIGLATFRVTGANYFAGRQFFTKTIEGMTEVVTGSAERDRRTDSIKEKRRREKRKRLDFYGADQSRIGWDREDDRRQIDEFMNGTEPKLSLTDPPPAWRMAIAWCCIGFGVLVFIGAIQSNFFPKTKSTSHLP